VLTSGLRNSFSNPQGGSTSIPALASITGLMTDPQFKVVVRALEQRNAIELMAAPRVTTLSGRQAQVQINDLRTIVTGVDLSQTASGGGGTTGTIATGGTGAIGSTVNYITQITPFGPVLDVVPYVAADGYTIELTLIPLSANSLATMIRADSCPRVRAPPRAIGLPLTAQLPSRISGSARW
jgi:type II secretory pathway component GspD/PulD (secretin)